MGSQGKPTRPIRDYMLAIGPYQGFMICLGLPSLGSNGSYEFVSVLISISPTIMVSGIMPRFLFGNSHDPGW